MYSYAVYPIYGSAQPVMIEFAVGVFIAMSLAYFAISYYRKRHGIPIDQAFSMLPPE